MQIKPLPDRQFSGSSNTCRSAQPMSQMGHEQTNRLRQWRVRFTSLNRLHSEGGEIGSEKRGYRK
jgi:hypothetical protein